MISRRSSNSLFRDWKEDAEVKDNGYYQLESSLGRYVALPQGNDDDGEKGN